MNALTTSLIATSLSLAVGAATATPMIDQFARVNAAVAPDNALLQGAPASAGGLVSGSADDSQLYWYNRSTSQPVSAIGGNASVGVRNAYQLNTSYPPAGAGRIGDMAFMLVGGNVMQQMSWHIDLGSSLLSSDVAGYGVSSSYINVADYGYTGRYSATDPMSTASWFDFTVGLWNGSATVLASALDQLNFVLTPSGSGGGGEVLYLGNNQFRFLETGGGSGTTLNISSALDDYFVRTFDAQGFDHGPGTVNFQERVWLRAGRTLAANEVPEPASLALFGAGLLGLSWIRRRQPKA